MKRRVKIRSQWIQGRPIESPEVTLEHNERIISATYQASQFSYTYPEVQGWWLITTETPA